MAKKFPFKDPEEVLDYLLDWALRIPAGDQITTSTWTVDPGITKDSSSFTNTTTTIWLSGGALGEKYNLLNHVVTEGGRTMEQTVSIQVKAK